MSGRTERVFKTETIGNKCFFFETKHRRPPLKLKKCQPERKHGRPPLKLKKCKPERHVFIVFLSFCLQLVLVARDRGGLKNTIFLRIVILDVNDHLPRFSPQVSFWTNQNLTLFHKTCFVCLQKKKKKESALTSSQLLNL